MIRAWIFSSSFHKGSDSSSVSSLPSITTGVEFLAFGNLDEVEAKLLGIGHPGRMIAADQFAAPFNPAPWNKVIDGQDPAAHAIAGLEHRHLVARREQLMSGSQPGKARTNDNNRLASWRRALRENAWTAEQQRCAGGDRALEEFAASYRVDWCEARSKPADDGTRHDRPSSSGAMAFVTLCHT